MNLPTTVKAVLFDLDGTLLDTLQDLMNSMNRTLDNHDLPLHDLAAYRRMVGNGMRVLTERALPIGSSEELITTVLGEFMEDYRVHCTDHTAPYDGILPMLTVLKKTGVKMYVVSNKSEPEAIQVVQELFGKDTFDGILGTVEGRPTKPAPDSSLIALEMAGCTPDEAVFVGDSEVDALTAQAANVYGLGATWGFRTREDLAAVGCSHFVDTPKEVCEVLLPLLLEK